MAPSVDPAILRALALDPGTTKIASHGGSGFASTFRITTPSTSIFVKTSPGTAAATMFEGEHASLNAINSVVPSLCPRPLAWGKLADRDAYFLATEFLDMGGGTRGGRSGRSNASGMTLTQKLAKLHSTQAPHEGYAVPQFGFPVTTCCGDTPQDNSFSASWPDFFARKRLLAILDRGEQSNGNDPEVRAIVERTVREVVPRLLGVDHLGYKDGKGEGIKPVVVHGDLWSGNHGQGRFIGREVGEDTGADATEEVIFDPSACYAHSEYDLGIMQMFGGFGGIMREYHSLIPKTEPVGEYPDRIKLYESYHHLNHWAIFGAGYRSGAMNILKSLLKKYGE